MKKIELLAPAGNRKMLEAAIHNGADAVYLSGKLYGARAYANNFTEEEIIEAIKYAHLYGVKIFVTINTIIKEQDVDNLIDYVRILHENNVDALIIQDIGMIDLLHKKFPNLVLHASTQCHNHSNKNIKLLKSLGVKRIILARELSLNEISNLDTDIEKEIFVHGALCISYSGNCLMSKEILDRSGNEGKCAGLCRLPYDLYENNKKIETTGKYLLSTKDLCTLENIDDILKANITSLKIEGRMKSPEYVGYTTKIYRKYIDNYYKGIKSIPTPDEIEKLKLLYNREFTKGHLFNDKNIINDKTSNHIGIPLGKIIALGKKIKIKLEHELNQEDAIRFNESNKGMYINYLYDEKDNLINHAEKGDIVYVDNKENIKSLDTVNLTISSKLQKEINAFDYKKMPIKFIVNAKVGKPLEISITDNNYTCTIKDETIELANNSSIEEKAIIEKLNKLGTTPFYLKDYEITIDNNIFIPLSRINNIRRNLVEQLIELRQGQKQNIVEKEYNWIPNKENSIDINNSYLIENIEQYNLVKNKGNIYVDNLELFNKLKKEPNVYLKLDRLNTKEYQNTNLVVSDISNIIEAKNNNVHSDTYLNITNSYAVKLLEELGVKKITLSSELTKNEIELIDKNFQERYKHKPNLQIFAFGKLELMIMKHCIPEMYISKNNCTLCNSNNKYELVDRNNKRYTIKKKCKINKILSYKITNRLEEFKDYKISKLISLIDISESEKIIKEVIK